MKLFLIYSRMHFSHTFDRDHFFKEFIRHMYVLTMSFILVKGREHVLHLRHHIVFYLYQQKKTQRGNPSLCWNLRPMIQPVA